MAVSSFRSETVRFSAATSCGPADEQRSGIFRGRITPSAVELSGKETFRRKHWLRLADARHALLPAFVSAQNLDLNAQEIDRDLGIAQPGKADRVFLGRYDHRKIAAEATIDETLQFRLRVAMVIRVALRNLQLRAEFSQPVLETLRCRDSRKRADECAAQIFQR